MIVRQVPGADFYRAVEAARAAMPAPHRFALAQHSADAYREMRCFLFDDAQAGFAIDRADGTIVNLFSVVPGRGKTLVGIAVEEGARKLDVYEGPVSRLYERHGFKIVRRYAFDIAFAQAGWNVAKHGTPDVLDMELVK